jgi:uncharacterized protein (TIGR02646 family)
MIHVKRSAIAIPEVLQSYEAKAALKDAQTRFKAAAQKTTRGQYKFDQRLYSHPQIVSALKELFHGKCAFCETPIAVADKTGKYASYKLLKFGPSTVLFEVQHFRPKSHAIGLDGVVAVDHYLWLAYQWSNLYLSCQPCNSLKASRFPIRANTRATPESGAKSLAKESPLLLDPCADRAEDHLVFTIDGKVASDTEEGMTTIEVYGLNRDQLIGNRKKIYKSLQSDYALKIKRLGKSGIARDKAFRQQLSTRFEPQRPYAALHRQFIKQWLHEVGVTDWSDLLASAPKERNLISPRQRRATSGRFITRSQRQTTYSVEKKSAKQSAVYYSSAKRIERIEIRNFKAIGNLVLRLPPAQSERESWMMLIGENGCGKSSILQAVGLTLMGEKHSNEIGLNASRFVRAKAKNGKGFVKVYLTNIPEPIVLNFNKKSKRFTVDPKEPKVLLLGYGATRLLPQHTSEKASKAKYIRIRNLFVPTAPLNDAEIWLSNTRKVPRHRFTDVEKALKDLLMLDEAARFSRARGVVKVKTIDGLVTLHDLSDGFQSVVAMCTDIMISLLERWKDMQIAEGIVLLDEIEGHLHPSWKIEIVERLRRCFPRVTFLVTTHDPLCLKGLNDKEIIVLRRDESNRVTVMTQVPSIEDLRADQILTSPQLFGLRSTIGKTPQAVSRYIDLMKKRKKTSQDALEIEQLRLQLDTLLSSAETPLEQQIEHAIQQTLLQPATPMSAELVKGQAAGLKQSLDHSSPELKLTIRRQLNRLWRK